MNILAKQEKLAVLKTGLSPVEKTQMDRNIVNAVRRNDMGMVEALLEAGADPNATVYDTTTVLRYICSKSSYRSLIRPLLEAGADPNGAPCPGVVTDGRTLANVCIFHDEDTVRLLLDHGADVNMRDNTGCSALHNACMIGRLNIVQALLDHGADVNARDKDNRSCLDYAVDLPIENSDREAIIDLLKEHAPELVMEKFCTMAPGRV